MGTLSYVVFLHAAHAVIIVAHMTYYVVVLCGHLYSGLDFRQGQQDHCL